MSKLLDKAIDQLKSLPEDQQDAVATLLLDEVNWEIKDFSTDQNVLSSMAKEALEEYRKGKTRPMNG